MTTEAYRILPEAHSYATYQNAEKKVKEVIEASNMGVVRYFIIAQPDGRFTPAVSLMDRQIHAAQWFAIKNIAVIG